MTATFQSIMKQCALPAIPVVALLWLASGSALAAFAVRVPVDLQAQEAVHSTPFIQLQLTAESVPHFLWGNDCADIEIQQADGIRVPHVVSSCDSEAQTAELWLQAPDIPLEPDHVRLFLFYANPDATPISAAVDFPEERLMPDDIRYVIRADAMQARVDLVVAKNVVAADKSRVNRVTFSLTVTNQGPVDARNVNISDPVPLGFADIMNISDDGHMDTIGNVNWTIRALAVGEEVTVSFDAIRAQ